MDCTGIRVIGDDADAVARLHGLLDFVGEPVRDDIDDVVMLVADRQGCWPCPAALPEAVILVGDGTPPGMAPILGRLREPLRLAPLLACLERAHAHRHARQRGWGPYPARQGTGPAPDLEPLALLPRDGLDLKEFLGRLERSLIEQALEDADHVVTRAADRLRVRRTTLVEKMRRYGIAGERGRGAAHRRRSAAALPARQLAFRGE